jgi:hypothetical protein
MMRVAIALAVFSVLPGVIGTSLFAQDDASGVAYENGTNLNVLYRNEMSGKLFAGTRGIGILFRQSKHVTSRTKSFYDIDLQTLRHPKELKIPGEAENRKRYVYGKLNSVLLLHGAVGLQNVIFSKGDLKAVEVRYSYSIGPTIAFAKPYYVQVFQPRPPYGNNQPLLMRFDSENFSPDSTRIMGRAAFTEGLAEMKVYPGVNARFNLSFEYAPYTNLVRAIETGVSLEYFPKALPIMARNPAEQFIFTFHVGFVFGRKWF